MGQVVRLPRNPDSILRVSFGNGLEFLPQIDAALAYLSPLVTERGEDVNHYRSQMIERKALCGVVTEHGGMVAAGITDQIGNAYRALYCQGENVSKWLPIVAYAVREHMAYMGCSEFHWYGRRGWARLLRASALADLNLRYMGHGRQ